MTTTGPRSSPVGPAVSAPATAEPLRADGLRVTTLDGVDVSGGVTVQGFLVNAARRSGRRPDLRDLQLDVPPSPMACATSSRRRPSGDTYCRA